MGLSTASPGRAATSPGVNFSASTLAPKRLELLRELVPDCAHRVLVNPNNPDC